MFCRKCGKEVEDGREYCAECEAQVNTQEAKEKVEVVKEINNDNTNQGYTNEKRKSKIAAGLLGIFLGSLGIHNFYLGYVGKGIAQLLMTVLTCGFLSPVSAIWGLIEGIFILSGDIDKDENGVPLRD